MNKLAVYLHRMDGSTMRALFDLRDRRVPGGCAFDIALAVMPSSGGEWIPVHQDDDMEGMGYAANIMAAALAMSVPAIVAEVGGQPPMPVWVVHENAAMGARLPVLLAALTASLDPGRATEPTGPTVSA